MMMPDNKRVLDRLSRYRKYFLAPSMGLRRFLVTDQGNGGEA